MSGKPITSFTDDYAFLSNFYAVTVKYEGGRYPTAEHAFQAAKSTSKIDRHAIRMARTPGIAKRMGRRLILRDDWEEIRVSVMREILTEKFTHPGLRLELVNTGNRLLVEGNTWGDRFWGACRDPVSGYPSWFDGKSFSLFGHNWLGVLLMDIRKGAR